MNYLQFNDACDAVMAIANVDNETAIEVVTALTDIFGLRPAEANFGELLVEFFAINA